MGASVATLVAGEVPYLEAGEGATKVAGYSALGVTSVPTGAGYSAVGVPWVLGSWRC